MKGSILSAMLIFFAPNHNLATKVKMSDEEAEVCTQEENKCVNEIVKTILMLDHTKKSFKQSDISKFLSKKASRKKWNTIFDSAKIKLKELGYSLVEIKNAGSKTYILTSRLFPTPSLYKFADESEQADRTLLILVLTYIFMNEGSVKNVDLFNHLQELKIYSEEKPEHEYFGNIKKKILNDFPVQLYLEKVIDKDAETFELKWGERAHAEVSKKLILNFVCEIGYEGAILPENLASQYAVISEEEKRNKGNDEELIVMED